MCFNLLRLYFPLLHLCLIFDIYRAAFYLPRVFCGLDDFGVESFNRLKLLVRRGFDRGLLILGHGLQSFNRLKLFGLAVLVGWLVGWGWLVGGWLVGGGWACVVMDGYFWFF